MELKSPPAGRSAGFSGLVDQGVISRAELEKIVLDSGGVARRIEESILNLGIDR